MGRRLVRRGCVYLALAIAAFGSIATSDVKCPKVASRAGSAELAPASSTTKPYQIRSNGRPRVSVVLGATAAAPARIRASLVPANPELFSASDGGPAGMRELALQPGPESTTELSLPLCLNHVACNGIDVALVLEQLDGAPVSARWDVIAETDSCNEVFTIIEET